jgi:hypothetical protein
MHDLATDFGLSPTSTNTKIPMVAQFNYLVFIKIYGIGLLLVGIEGVIAGLLSLVGWIDGKTLDRHGEPVLTLSQKIVWIAETAAFTTLGALIIRWKRTNRQSLRRNNV